jgi:hypothetical protein
MRRLMIGTALLVGALVSPSIAQAAGKSEAAKPAPTANLFPEAAKPRPGSHEKDRLENRLHGPRGGLVRDAILREVFDRG